MIADLRPGTSKWDKIECKLFSHISMNWCERLLTSHKVIVYSIAATTTTSRLTIRADRADMDTGIFPAGAKIPDQQMASLESSGPLTGYKRRPE